MICASTILGAGAYTLSGTYSLNSGTANQSNQTYTSSQTDTSAIYVLNGATLTLNNPTVTTSGGTSSQDDSSFYGLNAGVLATGGSTITINGGTVTTSGTGANGVFSTGTGTTVTLTDVTIKCQADGGHGVDATLGGTLILTNVDITTAGKNGAAIATDRGSGTITVTGGTIVTSGVDSPGIYSTGVITISGATITATGAEAAVIEGSNSITLTNTALSGNLKRGVMIYQSMSGDADQGTGTFTMNGGSLNANAGPVFYVTNTNAVISLSNNVAVTGTSGVLINAAAGNWGTSGSNGGKVTFTANHETLTGDITSDSISSIFVTLTNGTSYSGAINTAALTLDSTSTWSVKGNSVLTTLSGADISGTSITNINGNGYTVCYDSSLSANNALGGKTYSLQNGGNLTPVSSSATSASSSSSSGSSSSSSTSQTVTPTVIETTAITAIITLSAATTVTVVMKRRHAIEDQKTQKSK